MRLRRHFVSYNQGESLSPPEAAGYNSGVTLTRLPFTVALAALLAIPACGQSSPQPSESDLAAITQRGTVLANYDQAARNATAAVELTQPAAAKIVRYIARQTTSGWTVDFGRLSPDGTKFLTAYEAVQSDAPTHFAVGMFDPEREDTGFNLAAARGIELALKDFRGAANQPYHVAVLPGGTQGNLVYLYPAQVKDGVYPYGGDTRYFVSPDGTTTYEKRQLHKDVSESTPTQVPDGTTPAAGSHTHTLTNQPEDTDVFLVLSRQPRMPEFVSAGGHIYKIDIDGSIKVDPTNPPTPPH
jgi:hypothetical protein